jgi:acylpyruvate hydrolase
MKFLSYQSDRGIGLAVDEGDGFMGLTQDQADYPGPLETLLGRGGEALAAAGHTLRTAGSPVDAQNAQHLPPLLAGKIVCVGLNYADHAAESKMAIPQVPTLFSRFGSSIIAHGEAIRLPRVSMALDYEGELVAVIGKRGRYIPKDQALNHVAGYSVFNDGSIRDYQLRTPQWTIGKTFDGTGPFGPVFVTADSLPPGASGLAIQTRLNGEVMQKSSTDQLIFDVATLVTAISEAITLEPGDLIVTGTPAGVGAARDPRIFMKAGDVCEVEIEGIGVLRNPVKADD